MKVYVFTFFIFDKKNEIEFQSKFTTKPVEPKDALKMVKEKIKQHKDTGKLFCYKIEQDDNILGLKDLK